MALDEEGSKTFFNHIMDIWFNPELERIRHLGLVKEDYQPEKMQVILFLTGQKSIGFDKDVIAIEKLKANRNYEDCGHITFKKVNGNWEGFFDFRYNKGRAEKLFNTALEFFETAKDAYDARRTRSFVDNLFSAMELLVQCRLFVISNQNYVDKPSHKWTTNEFSIFVKLGNMNPKYPKILGRLSQLRNAARYHKQPFLLQETEARECITAVGQLAEDVRRSIV
jgi:hypothetical protein